MEDFNNAERTIEIQEPNPNLSNPNFTWADADERLNTGGYFVKHAIFDASAAADTAENEPKEVYIRFTKGNINKQNKRLGSSGQPRTSL